MCCTKFLEKMTAEKIRGDISGTASDAAHVLWGGGWRMPTADEMAELHRSCHMTVTESNGAWGVKFFKDFGNAGEWVFLPAAGGVGICRPGMADCAYWSSTPVGGRRSAYILKEGDCGCNTYLTAATDFPTPIRPVLDRGLVEASILRGELRGGRETPKEGQYREGDIGGLRLQSWGKDAYNSIFGRHGREACPVRGTYGGHGFVDVGTSVLWATRNIGAESFSEVGSLFMWGETRPTGEYDENRQRLVY